MNTWAADKGRIRLIGPAAIHRVRRLRMRALARRIRGVEALALCVDLGNCRIEPPGARETARVELNAEFNEQSAGRFEERCFISIVIPPEGHRTSARLRQKCPRPVERVRDCRTSLVHRSPFKGTHERYGEDGAGSVPAHPPERGSASSTDTAKWRSLALSAIRPPTPRSVALHRSRRRQSGHRPSLTDCAAADYSG